MASNSGLVDPAVFEHIQEKIDEDAAFQDVGSIMLVSDTAQLTFRPGTSRNCSTTKQAEHESSQYVLKVEK
jgi:hypothetical protein